MAKAALQLIHPAYLISEEVKAESLSEKPQSSEEPEPKQSTSRKEKKEKGAKKAKAARTANRDKKRLPSIDSKKTVSAVFMSQRVPLYIWLFALSLFLLGANQVRYHFLLLSEKEHSSRMISEEHLKLETIRSDFLSLTSVVRFLVQRQKAQSETYTKEGENDAAPQPLPGTNAPFLISTVSAPRANLREAPGEDSRALMNVTQGSRLLVEEQKGQWLKVYAPNGMEAWIRKDLVSLETEQAKEVL